MAEKDRLQWTIKGISSAARGTAKKAAKDSGMKLGKWIENALLAASGNIREPAHQMYLTEAEIAHLHAYTKLLGKPLPLSEIPSLIRIKRMSEKELEEPSP